MSISTFSPVAAITAKLGWPRRRDLFLQILEAVRQHYRFVLVGYMVMPQHIHLLISQPGQGTPSPSCKCFQESLPYDSCACM
jgi:hypothetical protein